MTLVRFFSKSVFFVYDGVEALDVYKQNHIDIVITDISMPKIDGIACIQDTSSFEDSLSLSLKRLKQSVFDYFILEDDIELFQQK